MCGDHSRWASGGPRESGSPLTQAAPLGPGSPFARGGPGGPWRGERFPLISHGHKAFTEGPDFGMQISLFPTAPPPFFQSWLKETKVQRCATLDY